MNKKISLLMVGFLVTISINAQLLTWTPDFPKDNDNITFTLDATKGNQGLKDYTPVTDVYVHVGVITSASTGPGDWKYVKFTWGTTDATANATSLGSNKWSYTINNIRSFFNVPAAETILRIAVIFRSGDGNKKQVNADNSDMYVPVYDNLLAVRFNAPPYQPKYNRVPETITKNIGDNIALMAVANKSSAMKIFVNGTQVQTAANVTSLSANPTITTGGAQQIIAEANDGTTTKRDTIDFFVGITPPVLALLAGMRDGINYDANNTAATLVLYAPGKSRVSVIGEFPGSNWQEQTNYVMNKTPDGNYWWLRITGLTAGTEYAFQYLVDGTLKVGEPYAEKILDPSADQFISATTYPNLKPYPVGQTGIVSILQTGAPAYNWKINNFTRPDKRNLVVYELLMRDFIAAHDWKTLRDTLGYFKNLGINAIEIMPFNEFDGNESWGYNPDYFLAPDKYYGNKNSLKELIDSCHSKGIAVIMDIALNHTTGQNPLAALYWDAANNRPAANNPWLNVTEKHPFNVFNDFNHESMATRNFSSRVMEHWLKEYKIDGYRFDLSKGFTQNANCNGSNTDVNCWGNYDASRIAIWKRYYDSLQKYSAGSIAILEHFAANTEEKELSDYGMMLWGNANYNFTEAAMGYIPTSNFDSYLSSTRGWANPYLVSYMESHDEERMMYKSLQFGNSAGSYSTKDLNTALKRVGLSAAFFLAAPGPKMIWQFGELGYDQSINRCTDGTINNNCRLDKKPILWNYLQTAERKQLYNVFAKMNKLRFHPQYKDVFIANNISLTPSLAGAFKTFTIKSANDSSMICVVGNFDVTAQTSSFTFPKTGQWFDYLRDTIFTATATAQSFNLQPGEYRVFLNRNISNIIVTPPPPVDSVIKTKAVVYPSPVNSSSVLEIQLPAQQQVKAVLFSSTGEKIRTLYSGTLPKGVHKIQLNTIRQKIQGGLYIVYMMVGNEFFTQKIIIP